MTDIEQMQGHAGLSLVRLQRVGVDVLCVPRLTTALLTLGLSVLCMTRLLRL